MIEINNLNKNYGKLKAVDNLNMQCQPGKITILLGENGAGKSTTIKSIANLLDFKGSIKICGYDNDTIEAKKSFSYVPEVPMLYDLLTVDEHLKFIASAYNIQNAEDIIDKYLKLFKIENKRKAMAKELSKGMKQKVSMILALITNPKAILIDEPMIGLDPSSIEDTLEIFKQLKSENVAVLISTHIIDIVEDIYDEAYILDHGKMIKHVIKSDLTDESLKTIFFEMIKGDNA